MATGNEVYMNKSIIRNIISKHTDHDFEKYSGASLQSLLTHNNSKLTYKLTLFFGYSASRNSVSQSIDITEDQYLMLVKEINNTNKYIICNSNAVLSDDDLYGDNDFVRTSSRALDDPTLLPTINTTTNTTTKKTKKEQILGFYPDDTSCDAVRKKYTDITKLEVDDLIIQFKDQMTNRTAKWKDIQSCFRNYLRKEYVKVNRQKVESFSQIKREVNSKQSKPMTLDQLKEYAIEEQNVHG